MHWASDFAHAPSQHRVIAGTMFAHLLASQSTEGFTTHIVELEHRVRPSAQGHSERSFLHSLDQQRTVPVGHVMKHALSLLAQRPDAQRVGISGLQGHAFRFTAQPPFQHFTSVARHVDVHAAVVGTHTPEPGHFTGY